MERYADIARAIGIEAETDEEAVEKLVEAVKRLGREVGEPAAIEELGISRENFERRPDDLVTRTANSSCTFINPRVLDVEDARKLFLYAFEGKRVDF